VGVAAPAQVTLPPAAVAAAPEAAHVPATPVASEGAPAGQNASEATLPSRLVLVTLDGVRWEDVLGASQPSNAARPSEGAPRVLRPRGASAAAASNGALMPKLRRAVRDRGVALGGPGCEHDMRASGPNFISLPGYLEMFTGKASGCTQNSCAPVATATIIDEARAAASGPGDVAVFASWNKYAYAVARDRSSIVLSAGAHAPLLGSANDAKLRSFLEAGAASSGYPGHGDYRPDVHTARVALRYLETVGPRVLVMGLGDADELAHRGDIAGYRQAIRRADDIIGDLDRTLSRMGEDGKRTAVLVTTDHGRAHSIRAHGASFPESQRVFVAAFGAGIAHRGVACTSEPLRLAHVAGAMRSLLALDGKAEPNPLAAEIIESSREQAPER
jgi:hypothetical protein